MDSLKIAHTLAFFSFVYRGDNFQCVVVWWFEKIKNRPDNDTGMWIVRPASLPNHQPNVAVISIHSIYCAAHLVPVYGPSFISRDIKPHHSYDAFRAFYVNKFADHHSFKILHGGSMDWVV